MPVARGKSISGRDPRLLVLSFDGTWAGGIFSDRTTVVPKIFTLIADEENATEVPFDGVGTAGGVSNWIVGGVTGAGTLANVLNAYKSLARAYKPGDRIIFIGYSRGAWAARYLALLIDRLGGLPKNSDDFPYSQLYKSCNDKSIWNGGTADNLMKEHEHHSMIRINAVVCFDTVGSLGLPMTGIAMPLRLFGGWHKKHDLISTVSPNIDVAIHAVALHEARAPFAATLMRGKNVHQVGFPGSHGSLGWMDKKDPEKLICGPLAWVLQQLKTHLDLNYNEDRLARCFPRYRPEEPVIQNEETVPAWIEAKIPKTNSFLLSVMGKKARKPGRIISPDTVVPALDVVPDLEIHCSVRLRGHGQSHKDPAIAGYHPVMNTDGTHYWARIIRTKTTWFLRRKNSTESRSSSRSGSMVVQEEKDAPSRNSSTSSASPMANRINEAKVGLLEARLLGLSPS